MKPAMYIFINEGLAMSPGKIAAQAAHAAVEAYRLSIDPETSTDLDLVDAWYEGGHYMKLVMSARDAEHLYTIERYIEARGFKTALIIDEGHTEIDAHSPTALGVALVDKDDPHTAATFGGFSLLKQPRPAPSPPRSGTYDFQKAPRREVYRNDDGFWSKPSLKGLFTGRAE